MEGILLPGTGVTITSSHPAWDKVSTPSLPSAQCAGPAGLAWFWVTLDWLELYTIQLLPKKKADKAHWYPESCLFFFFPADLTNGSDSIPERVWVSLASLMVTFQWGYVLG